MEFPAVRKPLFPSLQLFRHPSTPFLDARRLTRLPDQVPAFLRIPGQVEELLLARLAEPDVFLSPVRSPVYGLAEKDMFPEQTCAPWGSKAAKLRQETFAFDAGGDGEAGQVQQAGHDVTKFHQAVGYASRLD